MAQAGTVEVKVELDGADKAVESLNALSKGAEQSASKFERAEKAFDKITDSIASSTRSFSSSIGKLASSTKGSLKQIGEGVEVAGGKVSQAGDALAASSNLMTSALGTVISSIGTLTEGVGGLTTASKTAGASFKSMLGPIALIGTAVYGVVQAFKEYNKTSEDIELRMEALKAASAEYTSVMERLADENIELTKTERQKLIVLTRNSKAQTEFLQKIREGEGVEGRRLKLALQRVSSAQAEVDAIRKRTHTEAYFMQQSVEARARLRVATMLLNEEEEKLDSLRQKAMVARRAETEFVEKLVEERGRAAVQRQQEAAAKAQQDAAAALQAIQTMQRKFNIEAINAAGATLAQKIAFFREELAERQRLIAESVVGDEEVFKALTAAEEAFNAKRRALYKAHRAQREAARAQEAAAELAIERQVFAEQQKLEEARIRLNLQGEEQRIALIELRYKTASTLAQTDAQREIAELNRKRELLDVERRRAQQREQELAAIDQLLERTAQLQRDLNNELARMTEFDFSPVIDAMAAYGEGTLYAAVNAAFAGESIKAAVGEALRAVAIQATVQGLMETAKGVSALFTGAPSIGYFKAAGMYATAAAIAGSAGAALSGGGGGARSGGGGGASPSGAAQRAPQQQRDRDEDRAPITINVNMGNATIYDTRAAAERAFADRVVSAINTPRRGAVRLRRA